MDRLQQREQRLMSQAQRYPENSSLTKEIASLRAAIAQLKAQTGDREGAFSYLYNSLQLEPERPDLWERLGDLANFIASPASDYIVQYGYEEALSRDPERPGVRAKLASSYLVSEQYAKAAGEFEKVVAAEGSVPNWDHLGLLCASYAMGDQIPRGIEFVGKMVRAGNRDEYRLAIAILENAQGSRDRARTLVASLAASEDAAVATSAQKLLLLYEKEGAN
jgi:tetratricopeptide (TPR) repeat protein